MLHKEFFALKPPFTAKKSPGGWTLHAEGETLGSVRQDVRVFGGLAAVARACEDNGVGELVVMVIDKGSE